MRILIFCSFFIFFINSSCQFTSRNDAHESNIVYAANDRLDSGVLYFDSLRINDLFERLSLDENYRSGAALFYSKRNLAFAWITRAGINETGRNFFNLLNNEERLYQNGCILFSGRFKSLYDQLNSEGYKITGDDPAAGELELLLTINFFDYARRNWRGMSDDELRKVGWFIERKKLNYEELLDSVLKTNPQDISSFQPGFRHYALLKKQLQKYKDIEKSGGWGRWTSQIKSLGKGDTATVISSLKKQLYQLEDLTVNDTTNVFDKEMEDAVKKFETRHGLKETGVVSGKTLAEMSVPVHDRIRQILINMERCKWLPAEQNGDFLVVNIPAFKLFVFSKGNLEWSCNVIVGKASAAHNTVIFNDDLEYIVFSPSWSIPINILIKETLPEIKKDRSYLAKHNMEVVDHAGRVIPAALVEWENYQSTFPYIIRQKPGPDNALGLVKFLFPNSYDIYMHDTPEKSLFGETTRAFSHGCIRVEEPYKLAAFLLRADSEWTEEKINDLLHGGKQTFVKLREKVPVMITYFTAWVNRDGKLNFRDDIYHHDEKMKQLLFTESK